MTKMVRGPEEQTLGERLRSCALLSLMGALMAAHTFLMLWGGGGIGAGAGLSGDQQQTRGNGMKVCQREFRLDVRKRLLTERVASPWNSLPMEAARQQPCQGIPADTLGDTVSAR